MFVTPDLEVLELRSLLAGCLRLLAASPVGVGLHVERLSEED